MENLLQGDEHTQKEYCILIDNRGVAYFNPVRNQTAIGDGEETECDASQPKEATMNQAGDETTDPVMELEQSPRRMKRLKRGYNVTKTKTISSKANEHLDNFSHRYKRDIGRRSARLQSVRSKGKNDANVVGKGTGRNLRSTLARVAMSGMDTSTSVKSKERGTKRKVAGENSKNLLFYFQETLVLKNNV